MPAFLYDALLRPRAPWRIAARRAKQAGSSGGVVRAGIAMLSAKFDLAPPRSGSLRMAEEAFDYGAAVVLFGELDAKLPALIRGEALAETLS